MNYIDFDTGSGPEGLKLAQMAAPELSANKVKVNVRAFGVNRADTLQRQGKYPPPQGESDVLGLEVAGEVSAVGADVSNWRIGDKVFGLVAGGGYAEEVVVTPSHLMAIPEGLSFTEAAGLSEVFLTAYQCVRQIGDLQSGQKALIHAGASGVGLAAIQLCRMMGVTTAVTASGASKLAVCEQMGAAVLINYKQQDFAAVLNNQWESGPNFVLDVVAGDYLNRNLSVLHQDGTIVYLAMLAGRFADKLDMALLLKKRATIIGSTLRNRSDEYKAALIANFSRDFLCAFSCGDLKVHLDTVYPAAQIQKAHERLETNDTIGKLVITWE